MVKESGNTRESNHESPVKKRRKEESAGITKITSSGISKVSANDSNVYKQVIEYEETEALKRDPEEDLKLYNETCGEFRKLMSEISEIKATTKNQEEIAEKRIQASLLFVTLKKLNRLEKFRTKTTRDVLHKVKQQVDSQHLHLQNLLYEVLHLKKEVTKCLQFKSKDEEIDLVPVEEFYKDAPETISRPAETNVDGHQLKLARLEWELRQRKQLASQCQELHKEKETVGGEIQKKKTHIENLAPLLKDILAVTKPVQENLGFSGISRVHKQPETAYLLPHPLYFLYVQASAHREAFDNKNMNVTVNGDEEEAQRLRRTVADKINQNDQDDTDSDNQEEGSKRHHRKKSRSDRQEERKKQLLAKHPLSVDISITLKSGAGINLTLWYLMNLHIVSVKVKVTTPNVQSSNCGSYLVSGDNILSGLYPDDFGLDSPNVANYYQLKQVGMNSYNSKELGLAYQWAQRVCGFDFATADKDGRVEPKCTVSQANLPGVLRAIKKRLEARITLYKQVQALEIKNIPENPELSGLFAPKLNGTIEYWHPTICTDYVALPYTSHLVPVVSPTEADIFYKAVFSRGPAKQMHAAVILKSDFPTSSPIFALQLHANSRTYNTANSETIRDMEREINYHCKELCSTPNLLNWTLTGQVLQLLSCFDIFLEVNTELTREKVFLQPVRGKTRALPYKYIKVGEGIFTQH